VFAATLVHTTDSVSVALFPNNPWVSRDRHLRVRTQDADLGRWAPLEHSGARLAVARARLEHLGVELPS
jgi:hypothetical protein